MNALVVITVACLAAVLSVSAETNTEQLAGLDVDALSSVGACLVDDSACSENTSKLKGLLSPLIVQTNLYFAVCFSSNMFLYFYQLIFADLSNRSFIQ
jgi:hypothetical protein